LSIKHSVTTTSKPITNELVECMNMVLCNLLNKEMEICKNLHNWNKKVHHAMWLYNSTYKNLHDSPLFNLHMGWGWHYSSKWNNDFSHGEVASIRSRGISIHEPSELVELEENQCKLNMPSNWPKNVQKILLTRRWNHRDFKKGIWLWCMIVTMIGGISKNCFQNGLGHISSSRYFLTTYMNWFTLMERNAK
jgi:hypothetical protein